MKSKCFIPLDSEDWDTAFQMSVDNPSAQLPVGRDSKMGIPGLA